MSFPRVVRSPNGGRLWVEGPDGGLGQSFRATCGRGLALQKGIPAEEIDGAEMASTVIADPLAAKTHFDTASMTLVEEPERLERRELLSAAWHLREGLQNSANRHFDFLFVRHGDDLFADQLAPWIIHDAGLYWPILPGPAVDAEGKRHLRLLSKGKFITLTRAGKPSKRFVSLDLRRVWTLAEAFEAENPEAMKRWRQCGAEHWQKLGRRCG
jgi:hypothetical protein